MWGTGEWRMTCGADCVFPRGSDALDGLDRELHKKYNYNNVRWPG